MIVLIALATLVIGFVLGRRIERAHWTLPEFDHAYVDKMLEGIDESLTAMRNIAGIEPSVFETETKPVQLSGRTVQRTDHLGSAAPHTEL